MVGILLHHSNVLLEQINITEAKPASRTLSVFTKRVLKPRAKKSERETKIERKNER